MIDPMEVLEKLPGIPTSIPSALKPSSTPTSLPTILPKFEEYQKAGHVGTQTLWYECI